MGGRRSRSMPRSSSPTGSGREVRVRRCMAPFPSALRIPRRGWSVPHRQGTPDAFHDRAHRRARPRFIDIAPNLIEQAQASAAEAGLPVAFEVGDAERLPYADAAFGTVVSMFGTMFAARPERAAAELLRVTRPGGRIALASWTPAGFVGEMLKTTVRFVPPPAGLPSPLLWGTEEAVRERLGSGTTTLAFARRQITFEFPFGPADVVGYFERWYGPTLRAFAALEATPQAELRRDLERLWTSRNEADDGTTRVRSEYLEVIATVG
jgi:SAM-dependent methyltransferase